MRRRKTSPSEMYYIMFVWGAASIMLGGLGIMSLLIVDSGIVGGLSVALITSGILTMKIGEDNGPRRV